MRSGRVLRVVASLALLVLVIQVFVVRGLTFPAPTEGELEQARQDVSERKVIEKSGWLSVSKNSEVRWILGDGFDEPEVAGAWMTNDVARVEFSSPSGKTPTAVSLRLLPNVSPAKPSRTLVVYTSIDDQVLDLTVGISEVTLALAGEQASVVTLECASIESAADIGAGVDLRPLCIKLLAVEVTYDVG